MRHTIWIGAYRGGAVTKTRYIVIAILTFACITGTAFAQKYEANVYAGGFFSATNDTVGPLRNAGFVGVRGGVFLNSSFELGINTAFINHFDLASDNPLNVSLGRLGFSRPPIRSSIWEITGDYNFGRRPIFGSKIEPFLGLGVGFIDMDVRAIAHPTAADLLLPANAICTNALYSGCAYGAVIMAGGGNVISQAPAGTFTGGNPAAFPAGQRTFVASDNPFLTVSYGGGIRAARLWGPLGFRADVRGRTLPNFFSGPMTWPEVSAGLNLSWGDR